MQGRINQPIILTGRPSMARNRPAKSSRWKGGEPPAPRGVHGQRGHDHLLDMGQPLALEKHVLRPAQPDAVGAVLPGAPGVDRIVGIGPHAQGTDCVGPVQQPDQPGVIDVRHR